MTNFEKNKDKITVKIINKATQEIIAEFNGNEYEVLIAQEKVTEVNMNPKSCDNCGYSFIKANNSVQCYNPYTDFFSRSSHSPCVFWDKNKGLAIETIAETKQRTYYQPVPLEAIKQVINKEINMEDCFYV